MYKLLTKRQKYELKEHIKSNSSLVLNKIPSLMKKLIDEDPKFIKYVQGPAASMEIFEQVLNHPDFYIELLYDAVHYSRGIQNNYEIMKKICAMEGRLIKYCPGEIFTFELFEIALNSLNGNTSNRDIESCLSNIFLSKANPKELEKLIAYDGRLLKKLEEKCITKKMIKIAFANSNPNLIPNIKDLTNIRDSKKLMYHLCEMDGLNFIYGYEEALTGDLLKYCLNHPDPEKRLTFERIPKDFEFTLKFHEIKDLIKEDPRWLKFVDITSVNEFDLITILKRSNIAPDSEVIEHFKRNKLVLSNIINEVKKDKYTSEQLREMLSIEMDNRFIESEFFKEVSKKICELEDIDYDFFKVQASRLIKINKEAFLTLDFKILHKRFYRLYEEDSYEKLFSISTYSYIQEKILKIGNPVEDGKTDVELGNKRIELLCRMLDSSLKYKNGEKVSDWPVYYNKIIDEYSKHPEKFDWIVKEKIELTEEQIQIFTNHILGNHKYEIHSIDDLNNYEELRNKFIEEHKNAYFSDQVKEALLEKVFGISLNSAKELIPYRTGVLLSPELFHPDIVEFIKTIDIILKETDVKVLRKTISTFKRKDKLDEKEIINLRSLMKKQYLSEYNKSLFKPTSKPDDNLRGVTVYKAAGELGDKEFNLCIHSLGAYFGSWGYRKVFSNFQKEWNRPEVTNHGICSSYIGNSNLGMAPTRTTILGFTNYEDGALLLSGPEDIYSSNDSFDTMGDEDRKSTYLMPKDMIDYTRYAHNEMVFERKVGPNKRQPSYIVLVVDDYEKALKQFQIQEKIGRYTLIGKLAFMNKDKEADKVYHALKAARDFKIPIVVVETEKIAKNEYKKIHDKLEEFKKKETFTRSEVKEYFHDILVEYANNHSGCRRYESKIELNYFNEEHGQIIINEIKSKIENMIIENLGQAIMLLDELKHVMDMENEKTPMNGAHPRPTYTTHSIINYCNKLKDKVYERILNESNLNAVFNGHITDYNYLMEYKNYLSDLDIEQYNFDSIVNNITESDKKNILFKIKQIEIDNLYQERKEGAHSTRHIENVILFSSIIGKDILNEKDLDLLLTAALYHDSGRVSDGHVPHGLASSLIAKKKLKDRYNDEDIKIIRAAIEYHEMVEERNDQNEVNFINLYKVSKNLGLDIKDNNLMERVRNIATCLKDADALDRTRFLPNTRSFTNPNMLHHSTSKKLIKMGMQINEYYAKVDLDRVCETKPTLKPLIEEHILEYKSPKYTIRAVRHNMILNNKEDNQTKNKK